MQVTAHPKFGPDNTLPRAYHNGQAVISGFTDDSTIQVIFGRTAQNQPGTRSEYYTITNMSDPTAKATLTIEIANDELPMVMVGGDGTALTSITLAYGETVTISQTDDKATSLYVVKAGSGSADPYVLPAATASVLGGVKQGASVTIAGDGTLTIKAPTATVLGGVKAGAGVTIAADGTISVP